MTKHPSLVCALTVALFCAFSAMTQFYVFRFSIVHAPASVPPAPVVIGTVVGTLVAHIVIWTIVAGLLSVALRFGGVDASWGTLQVQTGISQAPLVLWAAAGTLLWYRLVQSLPVPLPGYAGLSRAAPVVAAIGMMRPVAYGIAVLFAAYRIARTYALPFGRAVLFTAAPVCGFAAVLALLGMLLRPAA